MFSVLATIKLTMILNSICSDWHFVFKQGLEHQQHLDELIQQLGKCEVLEASHMQTHTHIQKNET